MAEENWIEFLRTDRLSIKGAAIHNLLLVNALPHPLNKHEKKKDRQDQEKHEHINKNTHTQT